MLYHREIFMPSIVRELPPRTLRPEVTAHAKKAAASDRYGALNIPASVTFKGSDVVEAEFTDKKLSKLVVRLPYDATRDAIYAIGFDSGRVFLKTVWFNLKSDGHATLRRHLYATR